MNAHRILKSLGILLCVGATASIVAGCSSSGTPHIRQAQLQGEVFYLNRMALPENAEVKVSIQDVSLADAPANVLATEIIKTEGKQVPIPFEVNYNPASIQTNHSYSIRARIEVDGQLLYTTTDHIAVKLDGTDPQPIRIQVNPAR